MDGRSGSSSMRLNFAGVPDEDIREGIRRIGAIARPDTGLMGTLTGSTRASPSDAAQASSSSTPDASGGTDGAELAEVLELPRRPEQDSTRASQDR